MRSFIFSLALVALSGTACGREIPAAHDRAAEQIKWYTNYDEAMQAARRQQKPLLLFFTGSDWCRFCKMLEKEVFNTPEFIRNAGNQFIFVDLDFPQFKKIPEQIAEQNHRLAKQYKIDGYPTVIILSPSGQKLGQTGYRRGGPRAYIDHLQSLLGTATQFEQDLQNSDLATEELQELYQRAVQLGRMDDAEKILAMGEGPFFLAERYRTMLMRGDGAHPEAVALRQKLLKLEGESEAENHLRVALIEFQHGAESEKTSEAIAPLVDYLAHYSDDAWRVEMFLAQYLHNQGEEKQARQFADQGLAGAPEALRPNIEQFISSLWEE